MTDETQSELPGDASDDLIAAYINAALKTSDIKQISQAMGSATKLFNMTELAELSDIKRESLYRAFGGARSPNFTTVIGVLRAMGFQLQVEPSQGIRGTRRSRITRQTSSQNISD